MYALIFDDINLKEKSININKISVFRHRCKSIVKEPLFYITV